MASDLKVYELTNPSDQICLLAPDIETANVAAWLLTSKYSVKGFDPPEEGILCFFGGAEEAWKERYGRSFSDSLTALAAPVKACLASFAYGDAQNAVTVQRALKHMTQEQAKAFLAEEDDKRRTSMSKIVQAAHQMSERVKVPA